MVETVPVASGSKTLHCSALDLDGSEVGILGIGPLESRTPVAALAREPGGVGRRVLSVGGGSAGGSCRAPASAIVSLASAVLFPLASVAECTVVADREELGVVASVDGSAMSRHETENECGMLSSDALPALDA